ncbi:MAG TPA: glutathione S-transferase family protein [Noviherbaspirillum sp.]|uniref:glutathione S-transferase family protein n=1 Tax=Noviherbaspirillum sp. TaxID=1926288 RepID=UPI002D698CD8|nr:glutathione S-transferase family protein [Noviherbaspirillum sp.]HYD96311.1 glutathione S-transferase family protein [Noviherbaspirillum sp.]
MKLTLISHALCPYVQRAVIALKEKQAAFERIDIDLAAKPDWFLAVSPLGKTPVLLAGTAPVFESAVICEYLDETLAPALHPRDALQRAQHRAWIEFASAVLNGIWSFYTAKDETAYAAAAQTLKERFAQLEQALGSGPYFGGADFGLVDAAFAPAFRYFEVFGGASGVDLFSDAPKTRAWRDALARRASVREAVSADYPALLRAFVIGQGGVLGRRLAAR